MKLKAPITIQITEQRVLGMPIFDAEHRYIKIPVGMFSAAGVQIHRGELVLDDSIKVTKTDSDGNAVESFDKGDCQRLALNPAPRGHQDLFIVEQFKSDIAFSNARKAMKADDEIAALESAGVADGWLMAGGV